MTPAPQLRTRPARARAPWRLRRRRVTGGPGLAVVGVGFLPAKGVDEAARRVDLEELAREMEQVAIGWLHREAIDAPHPEIEVYLGRREALWPPPFRQIGWIGERSEDLLWRRSENALELQNLAAGSRRHDLILHPGELLGSSYPRVLGSRRSTHGVCPLSVDMDAGPGEDYDPWASIPGHCWPCLTRCEPRWSDLTTTSPGPPLATWTPRSTRLMYSPRRFALAGRCPSCSKFSSRRRARYRRLRSQAAGATTISPWPTGSIRGGGRGHAIGRGALIFASCRIGAQRSETR